MSETDQNYHNTSPEGQKEGAKDTKKISSSLKNSASAAAASRKKQASKKEETKPKKKSTGKSAKAKAALRDQKAKEETGKIKKSQTKSSKKTKKTETAANLLEEAAKNASSPSVPSKAEKTESETSAVQSALQTAIPEKPALANQETTVSEKAANNDAPILETTPAKDISAAATKKAAPETPSSALMEESETLAEGIPDAKIDQAKEMPETSTINSADEKPEADLDIQEYAGPEDLTALSDSVLEEETEDRKAEPASDINILPGSSVFGSVDLDDNNLEQPALTALRQMSSQSMQTPNDSGAGSMAYDDDEIDSYAKALLNQKTEMSIYADVMRDVSDQDASEPEKAPVLMDPKEAENTMADALDELRRERGQIPIDQEEEDFAWSQTVVFDDRFAGQEEDDFTTESLFQRDAPAPGATVVSGYDPSEQRNYIEETEKRPIHPVKTKSRAARHKAKAEQEETVLPDVQPETAPVMAHAALETYPNLPDDNSMPEGSSVMQSVYVDEQNDKEQRSKTLKGALIVLLLSILCLGGGYLYKVKVYDPAHSATPEQTQVYDRLKTYADDFDSLNDAQKKDMAAMLSQYTSMTENQKNDINAYFKDKTGKTFVEQAAAASDSSKPADKDKDKEQNTSDEKDNSAVIGESSGDQNQDPAGDQSQSAQNPGTTTPAQAPADATQAPGDNTQTPSSNVVQDHSAAIAQYEQEIAQLQTDKANYVDFLVSEGLPAQDEITASYDAQIVYYQNLLNSLR